MTFYIVFKNYVGINYYNDFLMNYIKITVLFTKTKMKPIIRGITINNIITNFPITDGFKDN